MISGSSPAISSRSGSMLGERSIDAAIHNVVADLRVLFPYLSDHWREHISQTLFKGVAENSFPRFAPTTQREVSGPTDGRPAGSDLLALQADILDPSDIAYGVLCCTYAIDSLHNPDAAVAVAQAVNDWQISEWFDRDVRLRGSVVIPANAPEAAAREIDRVGGHPGFVQVAMPVRSTFPYGNRLHLPMWHAIARNGLVGAMHFGGAPGTPPTPAGWSSYYLEEYAGMAQVFQSQVVSMVTEGLFDVVPNVRVLLVEAGLTWMGPFLWRFDKEWRNLRRLVPWVRRAPSAYVRDHIRLTIQPLDAPESDEQFRQSIEQIGSDEMILYASNYPHRHLHTPDRLLRLVSPDLRKRILATNAQRLHGNRIPNE